MITMIASPTRKSAGARAARRPLPAPVEQHFRPQGCAAHEIEIIIIIIIINIIINSIFTIIHYYPLVAQLLRHEALVRSGGFRPFQRESELPKLRNAFEAL